MNVGVRIIQFVGRGVWFEWRVVLYRACRRGSERLLEFRATQSTQIAARDEVKRSVWTTCHLIVSIYMRNSTAYRRRTTSHDSILIAKQRPRVGVGEWVFKWNLFLYFD